MINLSLVISPQPKKVKAVLSWSASIEIKAKRFSAKAFLIFWFAYCGFYRVEGDYFRRLILPIECWLVKQRRKVLIIVKPETQHWKLLGYIWTRNCDLFSGIGNDEISKVNHNHRTTVELMAAFFCSLVLCLYSYNFKSFYNWVVIGKVQQCLSWTVCKADNLYWDTKLIQLVCIQYRITHFMFLYQ